MVVLAIGVFMLSLLVALVYQTFQAQTDVDKRIGRLSPAQTWIERHLNSYSQDVYDMTQSLLRMKSSVLLYAYGHLTEDDYQEAIKTVEAKYLHFGKGTPLDDELKEFDSFAPSMLEVGRFIAACKLLQRDKTKLTEVLDQSTVAIDEWSLLNSDSVVREYGLRDVLEGAVVKLRSTLSSTLIAAMALLVLCAVTIVIAIAIALKYLQAVRSRTETIERLVASVGHDLRSPLQSINSAAALLNMSNSEERRKTSLSVIRSSITTLSRLVDDIVQIVRQEKLDYRPRPVNISEWYEEFCTTYSVKARAKDLHWQAKQNLDWMYVAVDPDRLSQCFGNLVDNAIKYSDSGTVSISLDLRWGVEKGASVSELVFSVTDEGLGIRSEDLKAVFKPFVRSAVDTKRNGMGLGLSIVSTILESQGGRVDVQSKLGVGSTFTARIPVERRTRDDMPIAVVHALPGTATQPANPQVAAHSILLVDDDANIRESLGAVLEEFGFSVTTAANGREALGILASLPLMVVVSDIQMPIMDGFELASKCSELVSPPFFIAQTAYTTQLSEHKDSGHFDICLSKPVDELELVAQIKLGFARKAA